jgi:hypothetical protein|tara:strand:- start:243 stop:902 length:660 start_codon:yes stop_codon:yes gene_type:complete
MKWINTKVEFEWNSKEQKYVETDVKGYHYAGKVLQCGGGGDSFGSGELVTISGSLEGIPHVSMSVGDKVLSANITGLPDTDVASEYLLWDYTGSFASFTSSQVSLVTSSVESITTHSRAPNDTHMLKLVCENGRSDDILVTGAHPFLVYSGSSTDGEQGAWYFEYAEDITSDMKLLSSSLEPINITSMTSFTSSASESFFRFDIEPYDVYFVEGVLVHN